jgi:NADPH:quinone reductase-like Zn-dependent oxidoreductase
MKAIVFHNYGSPGVLKFEDAAKPAAGDNQVLIKFAPLPSIHLTGT